MRLDAQGILGIRAPMDPQVVGDLRDPEGPRVSKARPDLQEPKDIKDTLDFLG